MNLASRVQRSPGVAGYSPPLVTLRQSPSVPGRETRDCALSRSSLTGPGSLPAPPALAVPVRCARPQPRHSAGRFGQVSARAPLLQTLLAAAMTAKRCSRVAISRPSSSPRGCPVPRNLCASVCVWVPVGAMLPSPPQRASFAHVAYLAHVLGRWRCPWACCRVEAGFAPGGPVPPLRRPAAAQR